MSIHKLPPSADSGLRRHWKIDQACTDFEACFRAGKGPRIEDYLFLIPAAEQPRMLRELVALEWELRRARGEAPDVEVWLERFPEFTDVIWEATATAEDVPGADWLEKLAVDREMVSEPIRRSVTTPPPVPGKTAPAIAPELGPAAAPAPPVASPPAPPSPAGAGRSSGPVQFVPPALPGRFQFQSWLGRGGHGLVCLALDTLTGRHVAVKTLRPDRPLTSERAAALREEARLTARLRHPGIVAIHEWVEGPDGLLVVEEYLPGGDLKSRLRPEGLPARPVVDWMIAVAEAVAHAHQHDLFHCDLKPANILLDEQERPRVCDFGLAILEEDLDPRGFHRVGTTAYMAPEQVRGESHRLDGRTDIWSLGVVLYELLTGRCPFLGTDTQIHDQVLFKAPRPLRELRPEIDPELERICLKCLSRRPGQRYQSALDLAADLRAFRASDAHTATVAAAPRPILPRGFRSFETHDHHSFLELVPGSRDQRGLPEPLATWRTILESRTTSLDTAVAIWHGPSGAGKSSLIHAGLIPALAPHVLTVAVEASTMATSSRILSRLRLCLPAIPRNLDLPAALALLREGRVSTGGRKLVIIVDQFEQWLHGWGGDSAAPLVQALRQCDGGQIQVLLLIRDEFLPSLLRLLDCLEIPLRPNRNVLNVQPFDRTHARVVLFRIGQGQGALPADSGQLTPPQQAFLDQATDQLSDGGCVLPVRLALFAELMKGHPWSPETLTARGGAQGLAGGFLRQNLDPESAPKHRRHLAAAGRLLAALLPPSGVQIRGRRCTAAELRQVSGLANDPRAFDELLRVLDGELRLITPVPGEEPCAVASAEAPEAAVPVTDAAYQLTHDYLVPAIRAWLRLKEQGTPQGRARQLLAEHTALWQSHPRDRSLPGLIDYLRICRSVPRAARTTIQAEVLARAGRFYGARLALVGLLLGVGVWLVQWNRNRELRQRQHDADSAAVQELLVAEPQHWPGLLERMTRSRDEVHWSVLLDDELSELGGDPESARSALSLWLGKLVNQPTPESCVQVRDLLLQADLEDVAVARHIWSTHALETDPAVIEDLWGQALPVTGAVAAPGLPPAAMLRGAALLAEACPDDSRWAELAPRVIEQLLELSNSEVGSWRKLLRTSRRFFLSHLLTLCEQSSGEPRRLTFALDFLADFASDDPSALTAALLHADPSSFGRLINAARPGRDGLIPHLHAVLAEPRPRDRVWNDPFPPVDPGELPGELVHEIAAAQGSIQSQWAHCRRLSPARFKTVSEQLAKYHFRPFRIGCPRPSSATWLAVIWIRDGQPTEFRDNLTSHEVLVLDREFHNRGWEPLGLYRNHAAHAGWTAVWGPGSAWGFGARATPSQLERVTRFVPPFPSPGWRVRFESSLPPPAQTADQAPQSAPLWMGQYDGLGLAVKDFCDRFPQKTASVRMHAETTFESPGGEAMIQAFLEASSSLLLDGVPVVWQPRSSEEESKEMHVLVQLSPGTHSLTVTQEWSVIDRRVFCIVGIPELTLTNRTWHSPPWLVRPIGPVEPDAPAQLTEPAFDVVVCPLAESQSQPLVGLVAEGYRPYAFESQTAADHLCLGRPRPPYARIDQDARRRARAALALLWLESSANWSSSSLLSLLDRRLPGGAPDPDPGVQTETILHLATYPLPSPTPWLALSPTAQQAVPPEARRALVLALGLSGRQMSQASRTEWLARLDLQGQCSRETDSGVQSALDHLLRTWRSLESDLPESRPASLTEPILTGAEQTASTSRNPDNSGAVSAESAMRSPAGATGQIAEARHGSEPVPAEGGPSASPAVDPRERLPPAGARPTRWRAPHGQDFAVIPAGSYRVGGLDRPSAGARRQDRHVVLERPFAIAVQRVPATLFDQFLVTGNRRYSKRRTTNYPAKGHWMEAAEFLNWLSEREGLQPVYDVVAEREVRLNAKALERNGYRLPTDMELEIGARLNTRSEWLSGDSPTHLAEFGMVGEYSGVYERSLGLKWPNPAGLFDLHGNGHEWLHDGPGAGPGGDGVGGQAGESITMTTQRYTRGAFGYFHWDSHRLHLVGLEKASATCSFRVARTVGTGAAANPGIDTVSEKEVSGTDTSR